MPCFLLTSNFSEACSPAPAARLARSLCATTLTGRSQTNLRVCWRADRAWSDANANHSGALQKSGEGIVKIRLEGSLWAIAPLHLWGCAFDDAQRSLASAAIPKSTRVFGAAVGAKHKGCLYSTSSPLIKALQTHLSRPFRYCRTYSGISAPGSTRGSEIGAFAVSSSGKIPAHIGKA